jgi:hypothetical protein
MASILLWPELHRIALRVQRAFGLPAFLLEPITHPVARFYGDCDVSGKPPHRIRLRVHQLNTKKPLARRTILGTLAHELAHLQYPNHYAEFRALRTEIRHFIDEPTMEI